MSYWKTLLSRVSGFRPRANQMDEQTFGWNVRDGKWFGLKVSSTGVRQVVELTGSAPGSSDPHLRAHQIDSLEDHPPVPEENRNKLVATNAETGAIELIAKGSLDKTFRFSQSMPDSTWQVNHNLEKYPAVSITDTSGNEVEGEVRHIDQNNLVLNFSAAFAGYADLN